MITTTTTWKLCCVTSDFHGICRALSQVSEGWRDQAIDSSSLIHDDDPDGPKWFSLRVDKLKDLLVLASLLVNTNQFHGIELWVEVHNCAGMSCRASIGKSWVDHKDNKFGEIVVRGKERETARFEAMKRAMVELEKAMEM